MGFVLAAVSPAVVVPGLLNLQLGGYGTVKGGLQTKENVIYAEIVKMCQNLLKASQPWFWRLHPSTTL